MPPKPEFNTFQTEVFLFNDKYKTNFSFEKFQEEVLKLNNIKRYLGPSKTRISNDDAIYRGTYEKLYKQAINAVIDKRIPHFDCLTFLNEFEELMGNYRTVCNAAKKTFPSPRGAWTKDSDIIKSAQKKLNEINNNKQTNVEERYKKGEIRIRDMRAYAQELSDAKNPSVEQLSTLLNYANALENTNKNRPFWWRAIHWIRNSAEKRYAEQIRDTAKTLLGDNLSAAEIILTQQDAPNLKSDMETLLAQTIAKEKNPSPTNNLQAKTTTNKENINKENSVQKEKTTEESKSIPENNDLKSVPIVVNINDVPPQNDKSLADLTATERFEKLQSTTSFKKDMMKEIMSYLKDSPITESNKHSMVMNKIYNELMEHAKEVGCEAYDDSVNLNEDYNSINSMMQLAATTMFENAYDALNGFKLPIEKKLVAAQKLSNLFLTKATPIGFYPDKFGKFANNYAIKNRDNVIQKMQYDPEHEINEALNNKIINDAMNVLYSREKCTFAQNDVKITETEDSKHFNSIDFNAINLDDIPDEDVPTFFNKIK